MSPMADQEESTAPSVYSAEVDQDKELKKNILLELVASKCNESSDFEDFRTVAEAVKNGDTLTAKVISGGVTNYSYKVFLESGEGPSFFAKIAFPYALWNPDRSVFYDTARTSNEYKIMKKFTELMGDDAPVATPYLCEDVEDMKILVTEWASTDEQWANQFIEGEVDHRVIPKLADAIATLNLAPFDDEIGPYFNDNARPCMQTVFPLAKTIVGQLLSSEESIDACVTYLKEMGQERFDKIMDKLAEEYVNRECITHNDSQCFNLLVEKKPSIEELESFGPNGDICLCDWEMSMAGPHGRDAGIFMCWPAACALYHAAHGQKEAAFDCLSCCVEFWDKYSEIMVEKGGKDEAFLIKAFRSSMGWCSFYMFVAFYEMGLLIENLPMDQLSEELVIKTKGAIGLVGIKLMEYGFDFDLEPDLSLEEIRSRFRNIAVSEIELLLETASKYKSRPRRASVLRASGRRVSDALLMEEATRKLSLVSCEGRPSIYDDPVIRAALEEVEESS